MTFWILNGPNLNLLGIREPAVYGRKTYGELVEFLERTCHQEGIQVQIFQSNHEGTLIDWVQEAMGKADGIIINPAGYTHTSVALADALKGVPVPGVEVHLSDIAHREDYRRHSFTAEGCIAQFAGEGFESYGKAIRYLKAYLEENC